MICFLLPHFVAASNVFMPFYVFTPYLVCLVRLHALALLLAKREVVHVRVRCNAALIALEALEV